MKQILTLLYLLIGLSCLTAQSNITSIVEEANQIVSKIVTDKTIYKQVIKTLNDELSIIEVIVEEENIKKGKISTSTYLFNLSFLNKSKIERKIKKSEMALILNCADGDFILKTEDDGKSKYVDEVKLRCSGIDELRDLEKIFQELISLASKSWDLIIMEPYTSSKLVEAINEIVGDVKYKDNATALQELNFSVSEEDMVTFDLDYSNGKKQEVFKYIFSLGNIDDRSIKVDTKDAQVFNVLKTNDKAKKITLNDNGEYSYDNKLKIYFASPTNAFLFKSLIENAIKEFEPVYSSRLNDVSNCSECVEELNGLISSIDISRVNISGSCDSEIEISEKDKTKSYHFNWGDVNASSLKLKFNGKDQDVSFQTVNNTKFIGMYEDEVLKKYNNKFKFNLADLSSSEYIAELIPRVVEQCKQTFEPTTLVVISKDFEDLVIHDRYQQTLTKVEEKECSYIFSIVDLEKSKSSEYEFNLYDVDENLLELDISGNDISLVLASRLKEKVFTKHNEKGKLEYTNKFEVMFDDLKSVRVGLETFKSEINACK